PIEDHVPKRQISRVSIEIETTSLSSNPEENTITTASDDANHAAGEHSNDEMVGEDDEAAPPTQRPNAIAAGRIVDSASSRAHAVELDKARGPKPIRTIEKLFVEHYLPLIGAVARSEVDGAVRSVVDGWRATFEHSYRESFAALRVTGKR